MIAVMPSKQRVAGSSPAGVAIQNSLFLGFFPQKTDIAAALGEFQEPLVSAGMTQRDLVGFKWGARCARAVVCPR
jgi:hypothetical protein